jgi:hypothetical protein
MTSRSDVLLTAERLVNGDRDQTHGSPLVTFGRIAALWSAYLGVTVAPTDVSALMILFKMARQQANPGYADNWIDAAGYAACGAELSDA